ncbi:MAG: undecaprenyl/decaprenyl-phosphate alpha-N-acetylglucosaminyl 1-phosphate transferase, partial [Deltaproteobacteria bacterium]|nr:undecaprenyl/decaprenyl-phosphate alpha-N-acetylglucosaminyl 1-phosphate transferase [Deltaproteobacteria bacterium]
VRSSILALGVALVTAALLTPLARRFALAIGAVDDPRADRRVHTERIPRLGGLAIVGAFFAPFALLFGLHTEAAKQFFEQPWRTVGLVVGGIVLMGLGAWDDVRGVRAVHKLAVQVGVAAFAYACGFRIEQLDLPLVRGVPLGLLSVPFTIAWIVGIVNAVNLIDGLDGLAAGVAFFACVTNFVVAYIAGSSGAMLLSAALGGAILGFLLYNFNPATIFMGDSGSLFLGYVLALISLIGAASRASTTIAIIVPVLALGVPIMDTLLAMVRRFLERRSIFSPDRGHIHHRLLDLGLTQRRAVLILYGISVVFCGGAIAVYLGRTWQIGVALLAVTVALVGIVRFVGYFEYVQLRRRQRLHIHSRTTEKLRRAVPAALPRIEAAPRLEDVQDVLERFGRDGELVSIDVVSRHPKIAGFRWRASDLPPVGGRDATDVRFELKFADGDVDVVFNCLSDDGVMSPSMEVLLQLVADALETRFGRGDEARRRVTTGRLRSVK